MAAHSGAGIVTDNLVYAIDQGTKHSWKGRPNTNLWAANKSRFSWTTGTGTVTRDIPSSEIAPPFNFTNGEVIKIENTSDSFGTIPWTVPGITGPGTVYSHSIWVYLVSGDSIGIGQHWNPWTYNHKRYPTQGRWERIEHINTTVDSTHTSVAIQYNVNKVGGGGIAYFYAPQYELGSSPTEFVNGTRSNTESLIDWTGKNTVTTNSLSYNSDNTFSFRSQSASITTTSLNIPREKTLSIWIRSDRPLSTTDNWEIGFLNSGSTVGSMFGWMYGVGPTQDLGYWGYGSAYDLSVGSLTNKWSSDGQWHNAVLTMDSSRVVRGYIDGEQITWYRNSDGALSQTYTMPTDTTNNFVINSRGSWNSGMSYVDLGNVLIYDRALTKQEVKQNFNALKPRFNV